MKKLVILQIGLLIVILMMGCPHRNPVQRFKLVETFSGSNSLLGPLTSPRGIVVGRVYDSINSEFFLTDNLNDRIILLSGHNDSITRFIGESGSANGQLNSPLGLAITRSTTSISDPLPNDMFIYVADTKNHRIQKYDLEGNFVLNWGQFGMGDGEFNHPTGIDIDFEGNIYVVDSGNHRIQVFDTLGNFSNEWGSFGTDTAQFDGPFDVATVYKNGNETECEFIAVSDLGNNRIQFFNKTGKYIKSINDLDDILGISSRYDKVIAVSAQKKLYIIQNNIISIESIPEVAGPYKNSGFFITDTLDNKIYYYDWLAD